MTTLLLQKGCNDLIPTLTPHFTEVVVQLHKVFQKDYYIYRGHSNSTEEIEEAEEYKNEGNGGNGVFRVEAGQKSGRRNTPPPAIFFTRGGGILA